MGSNPTSTAADQARCVTSVAMLGLLGSFVSVLGHGTAIAPGQGHVSNGTTAKASRVGALGRLGVGAAPVPDCGYGLLLVEPGSGREHLVEVVGAERLAELGP